ncbi:uncharacterized protein SPPG_09522, partial [Spizellomyces punctatus DAOM BR117]
QSSPNVAPTVSSPAICSTTPPRDIRTTPPSFPGTKSPSPSNSPAPISPPFPTPRTNKPWTTTSSSTTKPNKDSSNKIDGTKRPNCKPCGGELSNTAPAWRTSWRARTINSGGVIRVARRITMTRDALVGEGGMGRGGICIDDFCSKNYHAPAKYKQAMVEN